MAFALIGTPQVAGGSVNTATPAMNTTGADLIVVVSTVYNSTPTISDSKGITWTGKTTSLVGGGTNVRLLYAWTGSAGWAIGSGHTFQSTTSTYNAIEVYAFSGALTSGDPFNAEAAGANSSGATSLQPGSVSPFGTDLFVTGIGWFPNNTMAIDSSFATPTEQGYIGSDAMGGAISWKESASAENPTWSWSGSNNVAAVMASFKPAGGGGGGTNWGPWVAGNNWNRLVQNVR